MEPIRMLDLQSEFSLFEDEVRAAIDDVLSSQYFIGGPQVGELEKRLAAFVGAKRAVSVSSGTDALLISLMGLDLKPGDEVITTPFTFFATAGCIHRTGARPVFVDIEPDTFNIDPQKVGEAITDKTKAILPVHLFGQCADIDAIRAHTDSRGIPIIEDGAQSIGATYHGRHACTLGTVGCLSFYPTKNLGGFGEGGMVITSDEQLADRIAQLRNHGETSRYHHKFIGGNFRLNTIQAAVLLAKLEHLNTFNEKRQANAQVYNKLLASLDTVTTPVIRDYNVCCFHQYSILCENRDELQSHLASAGIGSGIYYPVPLHLQECFSYLGYKKSDLPISENIAERILSLPIHPMLCHEDIHRVVESIKGFYAGEATSKGTCCQK